jgi:hypothetical protein
MKSTGKADIGEARHPEARTVRKVLSEARKGSKRQRDARTGTLV